MSLSLRDKLHLCFHDQILPLTLLLWQRRIQQEITRRLSSTLALIYTHMTNVKDTYLILIAELQLMWIRLHLCRTASVKALMVSMCLSVCQGISLHQSRRSTWRQRQKWFRWHCPASCYQVGIWYVMLYPLNISPLDFFIHWFGQFTHQTIYPWHHSIVHCSTWTVLLIPLQ